jgi:hypothetical protein
MQEEIKTYFHQRVEDDWESVYKQARLWAMWIRYYPPISVGADDIDSSQIPLQVWFLTKSGLSEHSIWEFQRLQTVHFIKPWCGKMWGESSNWWSKDKENIGFASFAQYENTSDYYFDSLWGGLFGRGWKVTFDTNGNDVEWTGLWIS